MLAFSSLGQFFFLSKITSGVEKTAIVASQCLQKIGEHVIRFETNTKDVRMCKFIMIDLYIRGFNE